MGRPLSWIGLDWPEHAGILDRIGPRALAISRISTRWFSGKSSPLVTPYDDGRQATVTASCFMPSGFGSSVGFRAPFERAAFELQTKFEHGTPNNKFTVFTDKGPSQPVSVSDRNPYQVEWQRLWPVFVAKLIPTFSMPSARLRR